MAGIALLYLLSPVLARVFLEVSKTANESAYYDVLSEYLGESEMLSLRTSTPRPTYTPMPTYTPVSTATNTPTPTPIPPAFIIQGLETQAELVMVKDELAKRNFHVGVKDGLCSHGGDFTAEGVIEAGIDFDQLDEDRVTYDSVSQTFTLKLPAAELTSCRIEYIRLETNSFSMCSPDWDRARIFAEAQSMWQFLNDIDVEDMLDKATRRSEEILGDFVQALTGKRVKVISDNRVGKPVIAESCDPVIPGGWRYNEAQNIWKRRR